MFCRTIYEKLGSAFTEDVQQLYLQQVEEITPNIRYCAYNIGDQSAIDELKQLRRKGGEDQLTSHLDVREISMKYVDLVKEFHIFIVQNYMKEFL